VQAGGIPIVCGSHGTVLYCSIYLAIYLCNHLLDSKFSAQNSQLSAEMKEMNNKVISLLGLGLAIIATLAGVLGKG
jgi:hypothetical protein